MCYLASAFVFVNFLLLFPTPHLCSGMSEYEECMRMTDVGCRMVDECQDGTEFEETFEQCFKRSSVKCENLK